MPVRISGLDSRILSARAAEVFLTTDRYVRLLRKPIRRAIVTGIINNNDFIGPPALLANGGNTFPQQRQAVSRHDNGRNRTGFSDHIHGFVLQPFRSRICSVNIIARPIAWSIS